MRKHHRRRLLGAIALATASVAAALTASNGSSASAPPMPTGAQWAPFNVTISPAQSAPSVPEQAADNAASAATGATVLNDQYVHCDVPGAVPPINQDCYVVLVDPTQMPESSATAPGWAAVLVDPTTGKAIRWFTASG
jgi:hypothetical protein